MSSQKKFILKEKIGKGGFGEVFIAEDQNDKNVPKIKYAAKCIPNFKNLSENKNDQLLYIANIEIEINAEFTNDNLITFYGIEEIGDKKYMIFEYCNGGDLQYCIDEYKKKYEKKIPEKYVQKILKDILNGLTCLHRNLIVHHDIKPKNILVVFDDEEAKNNLLLDRATYKIADFGLSKYRASANITNDINGTIPYLEPQILVYNKIEPTVKENEAVDIWAVGILTYKLLTYQHPFIFKNNQKDITSQIKDNVQKGCFYWGVVGCEISLEALCFLDSCLKLNQNHRLSAEELEYSQFLCRNIKNFTYINENNFDSMPNEIKVKGIDDKIIKINMDNPKKLTEILNI
jgi:serine/threonine protein kinase